MTNTHKSESKKNRRNNHRYAIPSTSLTLLLVIIAAVALIFIFTQHAAISNASNNTNSTNFTLRHLTLELPPGVTLQQVDGGANYYAQFYNGSPLDNVFPIGEFDYNYVDSQYVAEDVAAHMTVYIGLGSSTDMATVRNGGMLAITPGAQQSEGRETVGYFGTDEADINFGPGFDPFNALNTSNGFQYACTPTYNYVPSQNKGCGYTAMAFYNSKEPQDGRLDFSNYGWGVMAGYGVAQAQQFLTYTDMAESDWYWFTYPSAGDAYYLGLSNGLSASQTQLAANYGWTVKELRQRANYSKPVFGIVEVGDPGWGVTLNTSEMRAAIWQSVIAGARGITLFDHAFAGPNETDSIMADGDNPGASDYNYYHPMWLAVQSVAGQLQTLNVIIEQDPFAIGYVNVSSGTVSYMAKYNQSNGEFYIFAGSGVFATPPSQNQMVTFNVAGGYSGPVTVLFENRTLTATNGVFTDTFANADSVHIYAINPSESGTTSTTSTTSTSTISTTTIPIVTSPSGTLYYVPITITNSQSQPASQNFQAKVTVDSQTYEQYEAAGLQNVEFFYANGTIIPSWLESGNTNSSTSTVYWLRISPGIGANSNIVIYMGFSSHATNLFGTTKTGEAPQLSTTYGQYDDGANVFVVYTNKNLFTTTPAGWSTGSYFTYNNVATTPPVAADAYGAYLGGTSAYVDIPLFSNTAESAYCADANYETATNIYLYCYSTDEGVITPYTTANNIYTVTELSTSSYSGSFNYANTVSTTSYSTSGSTLYAGVYGSTTAAGYIVWFRTRLPAPNNVQPSDSFGSIQTVGASTTSTSTSTSTTTSASTLTSTTTSTVPTTSILTTTISPLTIAQPSPSSQTNDRGSTATIADTGALGGVSPYTYQWLEEAPGAGSYTNAVNCAAPTTTTCTFVTTGSSTLGTYNFKLMVTDSAENSATSSSANMLINTALSTSINPSGAVKLDVGQSNSIMLTASGATAPYSYFWVATLSSGSCTAPTGLGTAPSYTFTPTLSQAGCVFNFTGTATDSATNPLSSSSTSGKITVYTTLTANTPSNSISKVNQGQSSLLTETATTGASPYTYNWLEQAPGAGSYVQISGATSSTYTFSTTTSTTTGTYNFEVKITDGVTTPTSATSTPTSILVNAATASLSLSNPSPPTQMILQGQNATITDAGASGGASPYTYQWLEQAPGAGSYTNAANCLSPTSTTCLFTTTSSTTVGTYNFELKVMDGSSNTLTSGSANVILNVAPITTTSIATTTTAPTTTVSPGGGGGGGGGSGGSGASGGSGGGGGSGLPGVTKFSNSTVTGWIITNFTRDNFENIELNGQTLKITLNYINPMSAGASLNVTTYLLNLSHSTSAYDGIYLLLTNVSYLPILHSVTLQVYTPLNYTSNATTANTSITTTAKTTSSITPTVFTTIQTTTTNATGPSQQNSFSSPYLIPAIIVILAVAAYTFVIRPRMKIGKPKSPPQEQTPPQSPLS